MELNSMGFINVIVSKGIVNHCLIVYGVDKYGVGKPLYLQNMGLVNNEFYEMSSI